MHKKFEIKWKNIKGGCQSGRKVVTYDSKSDLTLADGARTALQESISLCLLTANGHKNRSEKWAPMKYCILCNYVLCGM